MKSITATIVWAIATLLVMAAIFYTGYMALHSAGRVQSGWNMLLFIALMLLLMLFDLNDTKNAWLPKVLGVVYVLFAIVFGIHYFYGDDAIRALFVH